MNSPFTGFWFLTIIVALAFVFIGVNIIQSIRRRGYVGWGYIAAALFFLAFYIVVWITQT